MRVQLTARIDNRDALAFAGTIRRILEEEGCDVVFDHDTAAALGTDGTPFGGEGAEIAIVIGGDGTILRAIQHLPKQIPVLGINWGEVGFLADLEPKDAAAFVRTLPGGYRVEKRMRIAMTRNGEPIGEALNEALIVTTRPAKMLRFSIMVDSVVAETFRADGLIMGTPTGSTAYAMSAGGPIIDPRVEGFLLVPLAPYLLSSRPHIISAGRQLAIRLESAKPASLVIDGQKTIDLGESCSIGVKRSDQPARFIDVGRNFFEKVDKKLRKL